MDVWMARVCKKEAYVTPSSCSLRLAEIFVRLPDCSHTLRSVSRHVYCIMWRSALRLSCVNCWHFLSRIIARSSVRKTHPHTFLQEQKQGRPSAAPSLPLLFWDGPRNGYVSDMFQIHIGRISFFGIANFFSHPTVHCNFFTRTSRIGEKVNTLSGSC